MVIGTVGGVLNRMEPQTRTQKSSQVEVSMPLQFAGFAFLILFAGTFGGRWAILAAGLVLLFVGFALSGVAVTIRMPAADSTRSPAPAVNGGR